MIHSVYDLKVKILKILFIICKIYDDVKEARMKIANSNNNNDKNHYGMQ